MYTVGERFMSMRRAKVVRVVPPSNRSRGLDSSAPASPSLVNGTSRRDGLAFTFMSFDASMHSSRRIGDSSRGRRCHNAPYYLKAEGEGMVSVYRRQAENRFDPKFGGTMPNRAKAAALVGQLMRAETVVKYL